LVVDECVCFVETEIFDVSLHFLVNPRHRTFVQHAFSMLNGSLPTLCEEPSELIDLFMKVDTALRLMLASLLQLIDIDFEMW
jgi:hypothetical protein